MKKKEFTGGLRLQWSREGSGNGWAGTVAVVRVHPWHCYGDTQTYDTVRIRGEASRIIVCAVFGRLYFRDNRE